MSHPGIITDLEREIVHDGWATTSTYRFQYRRRDGSVQSLVHEVFDHGHGAAVLLWDARADKIALVRQFRLAAHLGGDDPMLLEACAGLLDEDTPEACVRREALEECAIAVVGLVPAFTLYASPGSLTEKIFCFVGTYDSAAPRDFAAHAQDASEDVETIELSLAQARSAIAEGRIIDAKTVALVQHLALETRMR